MALNDGNLHVFLLTLFYINERLRCQHFHQKDLDILELNPVISVYFVKKIWIGQKDMDILDLKPMLILCWRQLQLSISPASLRTNGLPRKRINAGETSYGLGMRRGMDENSWSIGERSKHQRGMVVLRSRTFEF